jgi:hypothetical protein
MSYGNKTRIAPEVLYLDIKYHMTGDLLIRGRDGIITIDNLECNPHFLQLLCHCILPKSIVIRLVQSYTVIPGLGKLNAKLEVRLVISFGHIGNDTVPILEDVWYPPYKISFIFEPLSCGILSHFHMIALLEIRKTLPTCGPILPLNTQVSTNRGLSHLPIDSILDVHIRTSDRVAISYVNQISVHQVVLVVLFIALCMHMLGDHTQPTLNWSCSTLFFYPVESHVHGF